MRPGPALPVWVVWLVERFGVDWTERFATAHEAIPGNPADKEAMDLYNDEVGRDIATANPDASNAELADLIAQAVNDGLTVVIDADSELAHSDDVEPGNTGSADDPPRDDGVKPSPAMTTRPPVVGRIPAIRTAADCGRSPRKLRCQGRW